MNSSINNELIYGPIRKALADKVLKAKGLTPSDKEQKYELLTGNLPIIKAKGRPPKTARDTTLAIDVMVRKLFDEERCGIAHIAKSHGVMVSQMDVVGLFLLADMFPFIKT